MRFCIINYTKDDRPVSTTNFRFPADKTLWFGHGVPSIYHSDKVDGKNSKSYRTVFFRSSQSSENELFLMKKICVYAKRTEAAETLSLYVSYVLWFKNGFGKRFVLFVRYVKKKNKNNKIKPETITKVTHN